ncbi:MAG: PD-(D/E)XK nuclease family protein [Clostridia bacterium]
MKDTNIFKYATSELSQDAFICFLVAHASEKSDIQVTARNFLEIILKSKGYSLKETSKIEIKKRYKNIDVLVIVDDIYIIIEDKIFTNTHDNQVLRYKQTLIDENIDENKIICVYYKTTEQAHKEKNIDIEFKRKDLIKLFSKCKAENQSYVDYLEYLTDFENQVNLYKTTPIENWGKVQYFGFFDELKTQILDEYSYDYKYVSNKQGGFSCFWIDDIIESPRSGDWFYIQIENNKIVLKYTTVNDGCKVCRANLLKYFKDKISVENKAQRSGKYMSVCHLEYDEKDYAEKLRLMINTLKNCDLRNVVYNGEY